MKLAYLEYQRFEETLQNAGHVVCTVEIVSSHFVFSESVFSHLLSYKDWETLLELAGKL